MRKIIEISRGFAYLLILLTFIGNPVTAVAWWWLWHKGKEVEEAE